MQVFLKEISYTNSHVFAKAHKLKNLLKYVYLFAEANGVKKSTHTRITYQSTYNNIFNFYNSRDIIYIFHGCFDDMRLVRKSK